MRRRVRRTLGLWVLAIGFSWGTLVVPSAVQAQEASRVAVSAWLGGVTDVAGGSWPVSPQIGFRGEARALGPVWLGVEVDTWFVQESLTCPGAGDPYALALYAPCDSGGLDLRPIVSLQSRIDLGGDQLRPYLSASVGRTSNTGLWSAGGGVRWLRPSGADLSAETRFRSSDRLSNLGYHHFEFVVGVHLR